MKKLLLFTAFILLASCASYQVRKPLTHVEDIKYFYDYKLDLNDTQDDLFKVELAISSLTQKNEIYNFVKTIPGSYSIQDIGRFVRSFKAFDENGAEIGVEQISTNKFKLSHPENVKTIRYEIAETWDSKVDSNEVGRMSGTSIESDHVLLNPNSVFGYFSGLAEAPIRIKLDYPVNWNIGTPAERRFENYFFIRDFDELIQTPFLLGKLTSTKFNVKGINVDVYAYSKNNIIEAADLKTPIKKVVNAASNFMERKPAEYYTFLFHFDDKSIGAHEHPTSSVYILKDEALKAHQTRLYQVIAHEFFHTETPFYICEKSIRDFDYENAVPTKHLWFYEGITEWAANIMLLKYGMMDYFDYFSDLSSKVSHSLKLDGSVSLEDISQNSYTADHEQYLYIYSKGALTATLMDIHLLDVTGGKKGLRDVIVELSRKYNPENPFDSDTFIDEFIKASHPSMREFIDDYVLESMNLPIAEYFNKMGVRYFKEYSDDFGRSSLGFGLWGDDETGKIVVKEPDVRVKKFGVLENDTLLTLNGTDVNENNIGELLNSMNLPDSPIGAKYTVTVKRSSEIIRLDAETVLLKFHHIFLPMRETRPNYKKLGLFRKWSKS